MGPKLPRVAHGLLPTVGQGVGVGGGNLPTQRRYIVCIHFRVRNRVRKILYQDIEPQSSNTVA